MAMPRMMGILLTVILPAGLLASAAPALATEELLFGPTSYIRTGGPPTQVQATVTVPPTLTAPFRLHVQNGTPEGSHRVSSATLTLNGVQVVTPADFNQQVAAFDKTVTLQATNTLQLRLTSKPGSVLVLTVFGTVPPPTLTSLLPPTLPITAGGTGTLTATISAPQASDTLIALTSSAPALAAVPGSVTVPPNTTTTTVTVTALVPGTATISATLNGSRLESTVTVSPAGPTLTALTPASIQVTQGASGVLTLTLSAAQATDTVVPLTTSEPTLVGLPPTGSVTVPAGQTSQAFAVFGVSPGMATVSAALNGSTVQSQVSVVILLPTVVSLLPPVLPLTVGSLGTLTLTLNASQPTATEVLLSADPSSVAGLPSSVIIPPGTTTTTIPITGLSPGTATVTASLNGSSVTSGVTVSPPSPTLQALTCPATVTVGATTLCTVTLTATQLVDTVVPLASSDPAVLTVPASVTVPASAVSVAVPVTALAVGSVLLTAGPLTETTATAPLQVVSPLPTLVSLLPPETRVYVGATASLTLTLNAAQLTETVVTLAASPSSVLSLPSSVTIPAGALTTPIPITGLTPGTSTVTATLDGSTVQSTVTVNQLPPRLAGLAPASLTLPRGVPGTLTVTISPAQPEATVVPLASSDPLAVEVPGSVTISAGAVTAEFPVLARGVGSATITAGPLNGTTQQATVTVTPAELVTLALTPPAPSIAKGEPQPFTATGTYTDGSTPDLTTTATWTSSDPAVAAISSTGVATGLAVGITTITAIVTATSTITVSATATLTVTPPELASLAVTPAAASRLVGQPQPFTATGTLTDGTTQDLTTVVTWTSSDPAVAIIDAAGLARALTVGTVTITALHPEGFTGSATLTVTLPPPTLTGFTPTAGRVGDAITLTGTNFSPVLSVAFNATPAAPFTITTTSTLTTTVPPAATTGPLSVTTPGGTATSTGSFVVLPTEDVQLTVVPPTVTALPGTSVAVQVRTTASGGYAGLLRLAVGALPAGVTAGFSTPALGPNAAGTLTLTVAGTAAPGTVLIPIQGIGMLGGTAITRTATASLEIVPGGLTTLVGRILDEDARPLPWVTVRIGSLSTTTDAAGNFRLEQAPTGSQLVVLDGSTATVPGVAYPTIVLTMTLQSGTVTPLPYQPYLHAQKARHFVDISNSSVQRVLTDPEIPGFTMTLPAGVSIRGWDGQPNQVVSVRTVSIDRLPIPPPPPAVDAKTVYMFYFNKAGGGTPTQPIPVSVPNELELLPGDEADLWYFDEAPDGSRPNAWAIAGRMTVSSDGQTLTTKPGVGIPRFCCGAMAVARAVLNAVRTAQQWALGSKPQCVHCNDPVQMGTGLYLRSDTDLVLPGRLPVMVTRTSRTNDPSPGPFGRGTTWLYDTSLIPSGGNLLTLILSGNARATFARQPDGSFLNPTEPWLRGARITPGPVGPRAFTLRFKDGGTWYFNPDGVLTELTDRPGNGIRLERTRDFKLTAIIDSASRRIEVTRDAQDRIVQLTDPLNRTIRYTYTAAGYLETVTDPLNQVSRYVYDGSNRLERVIDRRGITTVINEYDSAGRVARQTYPDGGVWTYSYTQVGGLITEARMTDPQGQVTTFRFNPGSYPTHATDALGQTTLSERAVGTNELLASTDPRGNTTRYTYDANGNVLTITDPLNQTTTFTNEPVFSQVTSITDPLGNRTAFEYDAKGNLVAITDPEQTLWPEADRLKTRFAYNDFGQPLTATDPLGHTTTFEYDTPGNLVVTVEPLGHRTAQSYDEAGRLLAQTDPRGQTTRFTYDPLDRVVAITDPLNGVTRFTYDPNGNLLTLTDAKNQTTTHTYNSRNRLETRTDALSRTEAFTYDLNGNLQTATDRMGQVTSHSYDGTNRRIGTDYADGSSLQLTYDSAGNLLAATESQTGTVTRSYDGLNRLILETTPQGSVGYSYDAANRRLQMQASGLVPVTYGYDASSRLTNVAQGTQRAALAYDPANRRTTLTLPNGITVTYAYDEASRLIGQAYTGLQGTLGDLTYQYDVSGNRLGTGGSFARTLLPAPVPTSAYDPANQQLAFGGTTQTFDPNGNLLTQTDPSGTMSYTWDAKNRLVELSGPSVSATFAYDGLGRRVRKTINGVTTSYLYDGLDLIRESGEGGGASYLRTLEIDEALSQTQGDATRAYLRDLLGNTVALGDSSGAPVATYTYAPFGGTSASGTSSLNPFRFTGRESDLPGLYYYRARYYDPFRSRFVSEDPIGLAGGDTNLYGYVGGNPVARTDPTGELLWVAAGGVIGAAINVAATLVVNRGNVTGEQLAAAAVSGAISGAVGALAGPLGGSVAMALGYSARGVVAIGSAALISAGGGYAGQVAANALDPCRYTNPGWSALWAGFGGGIAKSMPTANLNSMLQAAWFGPYYLRGLFSSKNSAWFWGATLTSGFVGAGSNFQVR